MYRDARRRAGLSIEDAAYRLHVGVRTLVNYEHGVTVPPPEVAAAMARVYGDPSITTRYCREECAIGRSFGYEVLDAVDTGLAAITMKLAAEMEEARDVLGRLLHLVPNKRARSDFTDSEWREFTEALQEFMDVEHTVEVLKGALARLAGVEEVEAQVEAHNRKCRERGYARKKKPLCAATGRV